MNENDAIPPGGEDYVVETTPVQHAGENLDLDSLDIPKWLKDGLKKLDSDGDGLEREEVDEMLTRMAEEKAMRKNNVAEVHYSHMPEKVQEVMRMWDNDLSGSVSVDELLEAARAQERIQQENRVVKRALFAMVLIIVLLSILNFGMSLAAVEQGKDFKPKEAQGGGTTAGSRRLDSSQGYWSELYGNIKRKHQKRERRRLALENHRHDITRRLQDTGNATDPMPGDNVNGTDARYNSTDDDYYLDYEEDSSDIIEPPGSLQGTDGAKIGCRNDEIAIDVTDLTNVMFRQISECTRLEFPDPKGAHMIIEPLRGCRYNEKGRAICNGNQGKLITITEKKIKVEEQDKLAVVFRRDKPRVVTGFPPKEPEHAGLIWCDSTAVEKPKPEGPPEIPFEEFCSTDQGNGNNACTLDEFKNFCAYQSQREDQQNLQPITPKDCNKRFFEKSKNKLTLSVDEWGRSLPRPEAKDQIYDDEGMFVGYREQSYIIEKDGRRRLGGFVYHPLEEKNKSLHRIHLNHFTYRKRRKYVIVQHRLHRRLEAVHRYRRRRRLLGDGQTFEEDFEIKMDNYMNRPGIVGPLENMTLIFANSSFADFDDNPVQFSNLRMFANHADADHDGILDVEEMEKLHPEDVDSLQQSARGLKQDFVSCIKPDEESTTYQEADPSCQEIISLADKNKDNVLDRNEEEQFRNPKNAVLFNKICAEYNKNAEFEYLLPVKEVVASKSTNLNKFEIDNLENCGGPCNTITRTSMSIPEGFKHAPHQRLLCGESDNICLDEQKQDFEPTGGRKFEFKNNNATDLDLASNNNTNSTIVPESPNNVTRRLEYQKKSHTYYSIFDSLQTVSRLRYHYEIAVQPIFEEHRHLRERRRILKEIKLRNKQKQEFDRRRLNSYESWVNERIDNAKQNHQRRRLSHEELNDHLHKNGLRKKKIHELRHHHIQTFSDEELLLFDVSFKDSIRYHKIHLQWQHLPDSHRRLLNVHEGPQNDDHRRRLDEAQTLMNQNLQPGIVDNLIIHELIEGKILDDLLMDLDLLAEAVEYTSTLDMCKIPNEDAVQEYLLFPDLFKRFNYQDHDCTDFDNSPFGNEKCLGPNDLISLFKDIYSLTEEDTKSQLISKFSDWQKSHQEYLRHTPNVFELDGDIPTGECHGDAEIAHIHIDPCNLPFLINDSSFLYAKITPKQIQAYADGLASPCIPEKDVAVTLGMTEDFNGKIEQVFMDYFVRMEDHTVRYDPIPATQTFDEYMLMELQASMVGTSIKDLPKLKKLQCKEDPDLLKADAQAELDGEFGDVEPTTLGRCELTPLEFDSTGLNLEAVDFDRVDPKCCKADAQATCDDPSNQKKDCVMQTKIQKEQAVKNAAKSYFEIVCGPDGVDECLGNLYEFTSKDRAKDIRRLHRLPKHTRRRLFAERVQAIEDRRRLSPAFCGKHGDNSGKCTEDLMCYVDITGNCNDNPSIDTACGELEESVCRTMDGCGVIRTPTYACSSCTTFSVVDCTPAIGQGCDININNECVSKLETEIATQDENTLCEPASSPGELMSFLLNFATEAKFETYPDFSDAMNQLPDDKKKVFKTLIRQEKVSHEFYEINKNSSSEENFPDISEIKAFAEDQEKQQRRRRQLSTSAIINDKSFKEVNLNIRSKKLKTEMKNLDTDNNGIVDIDEIEKMKAKCQGKGKECTRIRTGIENIKKRDKKRKEKTSKDTTILLTDLEQITNEGNKYDMEKSMYLREWQCQRATEYGISVEESNQEYHDATENPLLGINPKESYAIPKSDLIKMEVKGIGTPDFLSKNKFQKMRIYNRMQEEAIASWNEAIHVIESMLLMDLSTKMAKQREQRRLSIDPHEFNANYYGFEFVSEHLRTMIHSIHKFKDASLELGQTNQETILISILTLLKTCEAITGPAESDLTIVQDFNPCIYEILDSNIQYNDQTLYSTDDDEFLNPLEYGDIPIEAEELIHTGEVSCGYDGQDPCKIINDNVQFRMIWDYTLQPPKPILQKNYIKTGVEGSYIHPCLSRFLKEGAHCWEITQGEFSNRIHTIISGFKLGQNDINSDICTKQHASGTLYAQSICMEAQSNIDHIDLKSAIDQLWQKVVNLHTGNLPLSHFDCLQVFDDALFSNAAATMNNDLIRTCIDDDTGACDGMTTDDEPLNLFLECQRNEVFVGISQSLQDHIYYLAQDFASTSVVRRLAERTGHEDIHRLLKEIDTSPYLLRRHLKYEHRSPARQRRRLRYEKKIARENNKRRRRRRLADEEATKDGRRRLYDENIDEEYKFKESLLDETLRRLGTVTDENLYNAQQQFIMTEYEHILREKEQSYGPTFVTVFPTLPCWFLEEVSYAYYGLSPDPTTLNPCATLDFGASCSYDGMGADKTKFDECMQPILSLMGVTENVVDDIQAVLDGFLDPLELFELLGIDGVNPNKIKADLYLKNLASFSAIEKVAVTDLSNCPCLCYYYEMGANSNATPLRTCDQSDVGTTVGHLCEFVNAARKYGAIDLDPINCNGMYRRRRLEEEKDNITQNDCINLNGEEYCKKGSRRRLQEKNQKKPHPFGSRRHLESLPVLPGRKSNRSLRKALEFGHMSTLKKHRRYLQHRKMHMNRKQKRKLLNERLKPWMEKHGFN